MKSKAIVITRFPYESSWGGEESHTLTLAKHLRSLGNEVIFFGSCPILLQKFSELGFPIRKAWGGKMVATPFELLKSFLLFPFVKWNLSRHWKSLLQTYEIRALYCLSLNEKILLSPEALRTKIPVTWVEHQEIRNWLVKNPWRNLYRKLSEWVKIIPISNTNRMRLISDLGISEKNITNILNGVDLETIQSYKRTTQKNLLVCANRFIPKKGMMDFLNTLPELFTKHPLLEVVIVGEGEEEKLMREFIQKNLSGRKINISNFLKKENWFELLSKCDVFVQTARDTNETFSISTAEALASGCKVVVTKCSGIADHLENNENAFFAEPMSPKHLFTQIDLALNAPEIIRENGKKKAQEKFDQKKMLLTYESVILRS
jgi:glycosyltransferase involved in cell wall biosynthesis